MLLQEFGVAGISQQNCRLQVLLTEPVEDVTAHKTTGACEQDLQSDQAQFFSNRAEFVQGKVYLRVGVGGHQADTD